MRKIILPFFIFTVFSLIIQQADFISFAGENEYQNVINSFDLSSFNLLDDSTTRLLKELGVDDFDYQSLSDISITKVINHIIDSITNSSQGIVESGLLLIAFSIMISFYSSFSSKLTSDFDSNIIALASNIIISVFIINKLSVTFALCISTISLCSDFTYAFFTSFCLIVATSGGAVTSFSTNTLLLILSQTLNIISNNVFMPVVNCFMCLGVCASINRELNLSSLVSTAKNMITKSISLVSTLFVTILSIKTAISSKADALGLRSIRFAINSVVPVIGNSISEGLLSIQSYSSLIKTSVGLVGIISVFSLFLPSIIEVALWRAVLSVSVLCARLFKADFTADTINVFKDTLLIINVILILSMVTTVISIGILIAAKTGS